MLTATVIQEDEVTCPPWAGDAGSPWAGGATGGPRALPFDGVARHFLRRGRGLEFEMEVAWIRRWLPAETGPVLDLGCGIGALFPTIGQARVFGMDYSTSGLAHTRERFPGVPLCGASAERLPLRDGVVGAITAQHVMEHLPAAEAALRECRRVLRRGGVMLILTPNRRFCDPSVFDDPTHVRIFGPRELREAMKVCGFEVLDLRSIGLPWFRRYGRVPGDWRFRRWTLRRARELSGLPGLRWAGQTLCCAARCAAV